MKSFLIILSLLSISLFYFNFEICNYVYPDNSYYKSLYKNSDSVSVSILGNSELSINERKKTFILLQHKYITGRATDYEQIALNKFILILWWALKQNIYNVIMFLFQLITFFTVINKQLKFLTCFGSLICFFNIIDRIYFNVTEFQVSDILMIIVCILLSYIYIKYLEWKKKLEY